MIIRPTPWFMAPAAGAALPEITIGPVSSGPLAGGYGYVGFSFADYFGGSPVGSTTGGGSTYLHAIVWNPENQYLFDRIYSKTNAKMFTFPDFANEYFNTSEFIDAGASAPTLAPVYHNNSPYSVPFPLPITEGAKVRYIVTDSP